MYMNDGNKTKINLRNKSVFITGVAGFIGSNLAKRLLSTVEDVKVVGLDNMNHYYGLPTRLLDWSESPLVALYFALSSDKDAKTDAAVWVLNPMELNKKVGYGEYVPPISYDSLSGDLEGAFSNQDNDDNESQGKIIACHGVGCDLRMYVQQSDFTIHSTTERLDQILKLDESCDYFYKIRIPRKIRKKLLVQLDAMGFHESSIYPDMEHIAKEQATSHFNF